MSPSQPRGWQLAIAFLTLLFAAMPIAAQQPANQQRVPQQRTPQSQQAAPHTQQMGPSVNPRTVPQRTARTNGQTRQLAVPRTTRDPFQLTPAQQKRLEQLLEYWETKSSSVKTYSCEFKRFKYDAVFGPSKNPSEASTVYQGIIRYASPDKGEFKVESKGEYKGPNSYPMKPTNQEEHWICDGQSVYELDGKNKQLRVEKLPPDMQGQRIADVPCPSCLAQKRKNFLPAIG